MVCWNNRLDGWLRKGWPYTAKLTNCKTDGSEVVIWILKPFIFAQFRNSTIEWTAKSCHWIFILGTRVASDSKNYPGEQKFIGTRRVPAAALPISGVSTPLYLDPLQSCVFMLWSYAICWLTYLREVFEPMYIIICITIAVFDPIPCSEFSSPNKVRRGPP